MTTEPARTRVPRRVWGGTGLLVAGRMWGSACTLTYLYLCARRLSGDGFGRFTFYLAVFMLLDSWVDLGTGHVAVQRTASSPEAVAGVLRATRRIRLVTGLTGAALVAGTAFATGEPGAGWIALATLYPITHTLELSTLVARNRIAWSRPVLVRASAATASLTFVTLASAAGATDPGLYLVAVAAGSTLGNVALHLATRSQLPRERGADVAIGPLLAACLPIGLAGLCQQTYFYVDNLFVRAMVGEEALGHYNVAVRFMSYGIMVAVFAPLAALPWLTREHERGALGGAVERLTQPLFALAGLGIGLLWPWSARLLGLFGAGFVEAAPSLHWLLLACLTVYLGASFLTGVVATGRSHAVLWIAVAGLATNLAGNAWLVPRRGSTGAAIATLATEICVAAAAGFVLARGGSSPFSRRRAGYWIAGPALFMLGRLLSSHLPLA